MLYMTKTESERLGNLELGGSMTRQIEQSLPLEALPSSLLSTAATGSSGSSSNNGNAASTPVNPGHIANIGKMIEEQEMKMRNLLQEVYFAKTRDVVNDLRSIRGNDEEARRKGLQGELVGLLRGRA